MIKHVNFTGRRRIARDRVQIEVHDGKPRTFDATINLAETKMPLAARVFLEAMCAGANEVQRFPFGTVEKFAPPLERRLDKLDGENVFFALKVVDCTERTGRILGIAENIRPHRAGKQTATGRRGILPIEAADLKQQLWDLHFGDHDVCLRVNQDVPGLKERARWDPLFYAVVYPVVVREVLSKAFAENADIDEESERWPVAWLRFGKTLHPEKAAPPTANAGEEERQEWIDGVVDAFCDAHKLKEDFLKGMLQANGGDA